MVWPSPAAFESYMAEANGDQVTAGMAYVKDLAAKIGAFNAAEPGSSRRIKRFLVMTEPPSIDAGEITDKGYVNQRLTQDRRASDVARLFTPEAGLGVVQL
jgi:feruloyl-CoA synthase